MIPSLWSYIEARGRAARAAGLSDPIRDGAKIAGARHGRRRRGHILGTLGHKPGESQRITCDITAQVTAVSTL